MSEDISHECGVAALCWVDEPVNGEAPDEGDADDGNVAALMPGMLLDLRNRGQFAAGFSTYNPDCPKSINTFKDVGTIGEAFRMSHWGKYESILREYARQAAIGHTRYATSGADDIRYSQPFERQHRQL